MVRNFFTIYFFFSECSARNWHAMIVAGSWEDVLLENWSFLLGRRIAMTGKLTQWIDKISKKNRNSSAVLGVQKKSTRSAERNVIIWDQGYWSSSNFELTSSVCIHGLVSISYTIKKSVSLSPLPFLGFVLQVREAKSKAIVFLETWQINILVLIVQIVLDVKWNQ